MSENFFFPKSEKLCSDKLIDKLFTEGNREIGCFPVRLVYLQVSAEEIDGVNVLVSVSKRHFKRAVKRNRIKRQIREYYRLNNRKLKDLLADNGKGLLLALIFTDGRLWSTEKLNKRLDSAFEKLLSALSVKAEQE